MQSKWQDFLSENGGLFTGDTLTGFDTGTEKTATTDVIADLSGWGVLEVAGSDAATFLDAHLTNDVESVGDGQVQLSGYCSPKGRLLASFFILTTTTGFYLLMPADVIDSVIGRLEIFAKMARPPVGKQVIGKVAMTDVSLVNRTHDLTIIGVSGSESYRALLDAISHLPNSEASSSETPPGVDVVHQDTLTVLAVPSSTDRYLCVGSPSDCERVWIQVAKLAQPVTADAWRLLDIRDGLPLIVQKTQDKVVPQMANFHVLNGVSFTKGCYPGQEIVARMQYLGTLKRHMVRLGYSGPVAEPGTSVVSDKDQEAGIVISSASVDEGNSESLVVAKIVAVENGLSLPGEPERPMHILDLPYSLSAQSADRNAGS